MNSPQLISIAKELMADDKGLLAIDESNHTCNERFAELGIPQTEEYRRRYRELILTAPGLNESISGTILYDETIRQSTVEGVSFIEVLDRAGIIPGIKVDLGAKPMAGFPGEKITEGLDGLRTRLNEYRNLGARFAKWRAVLSIGGERPTDVCIDSNVHALARYAALCQEGQLVPVVEPEVLMDGAHDLHRCGEVTQSVLQRLFEELARQRVDLHATILKPNMVVPGKDNPGQVSVEDVADATVTCLLNVVPLAVAGIAFLSGGQASELASARLSAMNQKYRNRLPWPLTFSFARAIHQPALEEWKGKDENVGSAQQVLAHRARCNVAARRGEYKFELEHAPLQ